MVIPTMFWHSQNVHGQGLIHDLRSIGGKGGVVGIMRFSGWSIPPPSITGFIEVWLIIIFFGRNDIGLNLIPVLDQLLHLHVLSRSPSKFIQVRCWFFA